jgi:hypothetical protein
MRLLTVMTAAVAFCVCLAQPAFSTQPTPQPRRASGLAAVTMEHKLFADINTARNSGRNVSTAEKLKAKGDAELREGKLDAAIKHYEQAEKAIGSGGK